LTVCGIAGFVGRFDPDLLLQMGQSLAYRGPDDAGEWFDALRGVGLCHRRLAIIDLSPLGHQPMWDASGRLAVVFNGEIYNYSELTKELLDQGYPFASHSDTEVLLNLYLRDGEAMLSRLNGMFAFAIWDRDQSSLFIARDALGVKPLYYTRTPRGFLFASALHTLLCDPGVSLEIDSSAVLDYLTLLYAPAPSTLLRGVSKLEPGHALIVRSGHVERIWQWCELPFKAAKLRGSSAEAAASLREHLESATRRQMIADVPVGAFLSGGLDSSSLVALARQHAKRGQLDCFTIAFRDRAWNDEGMADDLPYARSVAEHLGVRLHIVEAGSEILDDLSEMIYHLDEPQADPAALHVRAICRRARAMGVKVLLSGTGGDDLFAGYRRHAALLKERYWSWLPMVVRSFVASIGRGIDVATPARRRLAKAFRDADRSQNERIATYFDWIDPHSRNYLLSSALRAQVMDRVGQIPLLDSVNRLPPGLSPLDQMLYLEQKYFLTDHNLNYTDKMSMAEGVEVRVPYLDPDLLAFSWSLPDNMKHRRGHSKWILKQAMKPLLPSNVIRRPKVGFGAPLRQWLHNELRDFVHDHLTDDRIRARGLFDAAGVRRLIRMDKARKVDAAYTIFALVCIEMWCRLFVDGDWKKRARPASSTLLSGAQSAR
jgi:asparagine synthase (glutamine-hydrolysing)